MRRWNEHRRERERKKSPRKYDTDQMQNSWKNADQMYQRDEIHINWFCFFFSIFVVIFLCLVTKSYNCLVSVSVICHFILDIDFLFSSDAHIALHISCFYYWTKKNKKMNNFRELFTHALMIHWYYYHHP